MDECRELYKNSPLPNGCFVDAPIKCKSNNKCIRANETCESVRTCP